MRERADQCQLVDVLRHERKIAAQRDAGHIRGDFAGDAAVLGRGVHLGIKRFNMRRPAGQPEPDDRRVLVLHSRLGGRRLGF